MRRPTTMIIPRTTIMLHKYAATQFANVDGIIILLYYLPFFTGMDQSPDYIKYEGQSHCYTKLN